MGTSENCLFLHFLTLLASLSSLWLLRLETSVLRCVPCWPWAAPPAWPRELPDAGHPSLHPPSPASRSWWAPSQLPSHPVLVKADSGRRNLRHHKSVPRSHRDRKSIGGCGGLGGVRFEVIPQWLQSLFGAMEKFWKWQGWLYDIVNVMNAINRTLKMFNMARVM